MTASVLPLIIPNAVDKELDHVVNRLWKEQYSDHPNKKGRDALGADATVISKTQSGKYEIHRLQLKQGKGQQGREDVDKVIQGFLRNQATAKIAYEAAGFENHEQFYYLASTRDYDHECRSMLLKEKIKLLDKNWLSENVWPDALKRLGKPFM
jgi:hypothetical protein